MSVGVKSLSLEHEFPFMAGGRLPLFRLQVAVEREEGREEITPSE